MTPATQREILLTNLVIPANPIAGPEQVTWTATRAHDGFPGSANLIDDFLFLERAQPEEMAKFVGRYGAPEIPGAYSPHGFVHVDALRRYARGLAAARRVGASLVTRRPGALADWQEMQHVVLRDWPADEDFDDWALGRERYASWLSLLFAGTGVTTRADWVGMRGLALEPAAGSLLGLIAILLAREVGAEGQYQCDSCGARVFRQRPPRSGENVYCDRVECKREQQRRNQAKWRANRAAKAKGSI